MDHYERLILSACGGGSSARDTSMTLGDRLRRERQAKGLSQHALAIACGVQIAAQGKYENGHRVPRADYLCALSELDIDVHYILSGVRSPIGEAQLSAPESAAIRHLRMMRAVDREAVQQLLASLAKTVGDGL